MLILNESDLPGVLALLAEHHAETTSEARAKRLTLAYEIKGHKEGVFASITFKAYGDEVKALEHDLGLRADVLRALVVKTPALSTRPVPMGVVPVMPGERPRATRGPEESSPRPTAAKPLSNEALEKKLEEILG